MTYNTVWSFKTARFLVHLAICRVDGYEYDGDDESGEIQAKLDNGEYVAFDSRVYVYLDHVPIASDSLGGSVYAESNMSEFWTEHRGHGGTYFTDMVREAIAETRKIIGNAPKLRRVA